jgi:hypothetical protein
LLFLADRTNAEVVEAIDLGQVELSLKLLFVGVGLMR